jgi:collagen type IV alpha-3-binding protein
MEWEATLESCKLVEKLASDSLIFHQVIKRVWPSAQRDSCFWSHIRSFDQAGSSKSTGLKSWIVVNYSTDHANAPLKDGIVRAQANVAMICSTEITNKKKEHNLSACTRDDIACNITYVSQVNPGGWVPAKALRAVYKNVYPKFVKGFGEFVIQKTKNKEILF